MLSGVPHHNKYLKQVWMFSYEYTIIKIKIHSGKFRSLAGVGLKAP